MLTITLPPEIENRLKGEASRHGLAVADYASKLIEAALPKPAVDQVTIDLLARFERGASAKFLNPCSLPLRGFSV